MVSLNKALFAECSLLKVVDLWASLNDNDGYDADSLSIVFSNSKIISAIVFSKLVDSGLVNYSDKVMS